MHCALCPMRDGALHVLVELPACSLCAAYGIVTTHLLTAVF